MKVTQVAVCPSEASQKAGRPALTPELLAASGARYSRNNEGLDAILAKIDPGNLEKSVDSIFKMVDYGHQSIADMVPVAMFIDGISIWLAYYIWTLCPTAGGQESSTRYIRISIDGLVPPETLGIPSSHVPTWRDLMIQCYDAYQGSLKIWEELALANPDLMGIPRSLLQDTSESAHKKVARMTRNYAFDRARYFLPVAAATNTMLVMSARGWVHLCQHLLSQPLSEPRQLGEKIRQELAITAPRMLRHARATEAHQHFLEQEFSRLTDLARRAGPLPVRPVPNAPDPAQPYLSISMPEDCSPETIANSLRPHPNRYSPVGTPIQRTAVRFGWTAIGFAEIRDLNRHRTGTKYCPQCPKGFYFALDQLPADTDSCGATLLQRAETGLAACETAARLLREGDPSYIYWSLLGTEYPFEHTTTADKFLYEAELRTGLGAHYRYAKHLRDVLALWYEKFPSTRGLVLEGTAEPE